MSNDQELEELEDRIKGTLSARIDGLMQRTRDIDEESIASIASHYTALQAVEWYKREHN